MRELFSALSVFDWVSPIIGTVKDLLWMAGGDEQSSTVWLSKYAIGEATSALARKGIKVISTTMVAQNDEGGIDVRASQEGLVRILLDGEGVETW